MNSLRYEIPASIEALAQCLERADTSTHLLGGGTDLLPRFHGRAGGGVTLIDMTSIKGLDTIETSGGSVTIGANVTYTRIGQDPFIRKCLPCLSTMASQIGSVQIRNTARLPGNLANASPGGDAIGTLMALDAAAMILDAKGSTRAVCVADLVLGTGKTSLARSEAIIGIWIPVPESSRNGFGKIGLAARREVVIANVSLTMVFDFQEAEERIRNARIVLGAAAPKAFRATAAEALCLGRKPSALLAGELTDCLRLTVQDSIHGNPMFLHKLNDVQGLAWDVFHAIFSDLY